jgi:hypothetical protein
MTVDVLANGDARLGADVDCWRVSATFPEIPCSLQKNSPVPPKQFPVRYFTWPDSRLGDDGLPIGRAFIDFSVGAAKGAVHVAPTQRDAK